jgi:hypothetical protein
VNLRLLDTQLKENLSDELLDVVERIREELKASEQTVRSMGSLRLSAGEEAATERE